MSSQEAPTKLYVTTGKNVAYALVDELMVMVVGDRPLSNEEWAELLELLDRHQEEPRQGSLTYSPTTTINAKQRKMLYSWALIRNKQLARHNALITDSILVRGAMVPLSWFTPNVEYRAFSTAKIDEAFGWLALRVSFDLPEARAALEEMKRVTRRG